MRCATWDLLVYADEEMQESLANPEGTYFC